MAQSEGMPAGEAPLRAVRGADLTSATAQTAGMRRYEAISGRTVGARGLWVGRVLAPAGEVSAPHHHGESESAIYIAAGRASFLFGPDLRQRLDVEAGDFVFVPPWTVHVEANLAGEDATLIVARSTQEAIVVNVPGLALPEDLLGRQPDERGIDVY